MIFYCDGSKAALGSQIMVTNDVGEILDNTVFKYKKEYTNNELEYEAILKAFLLASTHATIYSDSKLCVEQINGNFKIKQDNLIPYAEKAKSLKEEKELTIIWLPRKENKAGVILEKKVKQEKSAAQRRRNKKISSARRKRRKKI